MLSIVLQELGVIGPFALLDHKEFELAYYTTSMDIDHNSFAPTGQPGIDACLWTSPCLWTLP